MSDNLTREETQRYVNSLQELPNTSKCSEGHDHKAPGERLFGRLRGRKLTSIRSYVDDENNVVLGFIFEGGEGVLVTPLGVALYFPHAGEHGIEHGPVVDCV